MKRSRAAKPEWVRHVGTLGISYASNKNREQKKGVPPPPQKKKKNIDKRGKLIFTDGGVFDIHVVVGINQTAHHNVCTSTVHYSSYIHHHCLRAAQSPTHCGTKTILFEKEKVMVPGTYG